MTVAYVDVFIANVMVLLKIREQWNLQIPSNTKQAPYLQLTQQHRTAVGVSQFPDGIHLYAAVIHPANYGKSFSALLAP